MRFLIRARHPLDTFALYFALGREHILDYANGYDHILFVMALCAVSLPRDWKRVAILVTAFTVGHSITLALTTLDMLTADPRKVEFFIPVTIFVTASGHLFRKNEGRRTGFLQINYVLALLFGLIHGMGFASYLRAILGTSHSVALPLLSFNLGLELGQLIVVFVFLLVSQAAIEWLGVAQKSWRLVICGGIAGAALVLAQQNIFW